MRKNPGSFYRDDPESWQPLTRLVLLVKEVVGQTCQTITRVLNESSVARSFAYVMPLLLTGIDKVEYSSTSLGTVRYGAATVPPQRPP